MLSVIVPVYNVEPYLRQCIDSILAQADCDFELILVDDGSPDRCPEICDAYAKSDARVTVIHKPNGGLVSARKAGFAQSRGEYVTFLDSDDRIEADYLKTVAEPIERERPDLIAVTAYRSLTDQTTQECHIGSHHRGFYGKERLQTELYPFLFRSYPTFSFDLSPTLWTKIIRRELVERFLPSLPENLRLGEDLALTLPCILAADSIYFTDRGGYVYRQNPTSITNSHDPSSPERIKTLLDTLRRETEQFAIPNMQEQLAAYAVYVTEFTAKSVIRNSSDLKTELASLRVLKNDPSLRLGMKRKIPLKTRAILTAAFANQVRLLRIVRRIKFGKEGSRG